MSKREQILSALFERLKSLDITIKRNELAPQAIPKNGILILTGLLRHKKRTAFFFILIISSNPCAVSRRPNKLNGESQKPTPHKEV